MIQLGDKDALCGCFSYSVFLGCWCATKDPKQHLGMFNRWPTGGVAFIHC